MLTEAGVSVTPK